MLLYCTTLTGPLERRLQSSGCQTTALERIVALIRDLFHHPAAVSSMDAKVKMVPCAEAKLYSKTLKNSVVSSLHLLASSKCDSLRCDLGILARFLVHAVCRLQGPI